MIIAVCGASGAGKDTVADYIVSKYGFQHMAFADALKALCAQKYHIPLTYFYASKDTVIDKINKTPRDIMITEAAYARSVFGDDVFVDIVFNKINKFPYKDYVISDLRFYNELRRVRIVGGKSWFLIREQRQSINVQCGLEILPEHCDLVIENNSSIDDLFKSIDKNIGGMIR